MPILSGALASPRRSAAMLFLLLLAMLAAPAPVSAAPARFDPRAFFNGRTEGAGKLKIVFRSAIDVRDEGNGHVESDGTLNLRQVVHEGDKPARTRLWRIRETAPGRYTGTLSDAKGAVTGEVTGNSLHLAFTAIDGYGHEQWITLAPDGRSARNVLKVRKLGMTVAQLEATIRKLD